MKLVYTIPIGTKVCRYGIGGTEWLTSTKKVVYGIRDRLILKDEILKAILPFQKYARLETINDDEFFWFKTPDKEYPVVVVYKNEVEVKDIDE
jgi:hypothetical protein